MHRQRTHPVLFLLLIALQAPAQSIPLNGVVVIQNSEYRTGTRQYVSDASIRAPFAKAVTTDRTGQFLLEVVGMGPGAVTSLTVTKPGLQVVNQQELGRVALGNVRSQIVVMADPDQLAAAQMAYYNIAVEGITRTFAKRIAALRAENDRLRAEQQSTAPTGPTLGDALVSLTEQRDRAVENAAGVAQQIAAVDLDGASVLYKKAFALFEQGEVDSMLAVLSVATLDEDYRAAVANKGRAEETATKILADADHRMEQVLETYWLKYQALKAMMELEKAHDLLGRMDTIIQTHGDIFDPHHRITLRCEQGMIQYLMGNRQQAVRPTEEALAMADSLLAQDDVLQGPLLREYALALSGVGRFTEAIEVTHRAIAWFEEQVPPDIAEIGTLYCRSSELYLLSGDVEGALLATGKALDWAARDTLVADRTFRSTAYLYAGDLHFMTGEIQKGVAEAAKGFRIARSNLSAKSAQMKAAYAYQAMASFYANDPHAAFCYVDTSLTREIAALGKDHPGVAYLYATRGSISEGIGDIAGAEVDYRKALVIKQHLYGADHPVMANVYNQVGSVSRLNGSPDTALVLFHKALSVALVPGKDAPFATVDTYQQLGMVYRTLGMPDSAIVAFKCSRAIAVRAVGAASPTAIVCLTGEGSALLDKGDYPNAQALLDSALRAYAAIEQQECWGAADAWNKLSDLHFRRLRYDSAQLDSERALAIYEAIRLQEDPGAVFSRARSVRVRAHQGDAGAGATALDSLITALSGTYVEHCGQIGDVLLWSSEAHALAGNRDTAITRAQAALNVYQRIFHPDHPRVIEARNGLARLYYEAGRTDLAGAVVEASWNARPSADAAWLQYQLATDAGRDEEALDRLVRCARAQDAWPGTLTAERERTRAALHTVANKLGRTDLLKEFGTK